jgi:hypothetical protein
MTHYYKQNNLKLPSVTTIISDCTDKSPALLPWAANQVVESIKGKATNIYIKDFPCEREGLYYLVTSEMLTNAAKNFKKTSKNALDIGSMVHNAIEEHLRGNLVPRLPNKQAGNAFNAFLEWEAENKLETIAVEQTVYGDGWAGTLDWIGKLNGKLFVIDWKTSKDFYIDHRYQIAAYRSVALDTDDIGSGVLRIDKNTGFPEFRDFSKHYEKDLAVFKAMAKLYFLRHPKIAKAAGK